MKASPTLVKATLPTSKRARRKLDSPERRAQGASQDQNKAIKTRKENDKSSESAGKSSASNNSSKAKAEEGTNNKGDSKPSKLASKTSPRRGTQKAKKAKTQAMASAKIHRVKAANKSSISQDTPDFVRRVLSPMAAVDMPQDGVTSKIPKVVRKVIQLRISKPKQKLLTRLSFKKIVASRFQDGVTCKSRRAGVRGKLQKGSYFGKQKPSPAAGKKNATEVKAGRTTKDVNRFTSSEIQIQTVRAEELHIASRCCLLGNES